MFARAQRDAVPSEQIEAVHRAGYGTYGAYRVHNRLRRQGVHRRDRRRTALAGQRGPSAMF
jgi:hypothetical protein